MRIALLLDNDRLLHPRFLARVAADCRTEGHTLYVVVVTSLVTTRTIRDRCRLAWRQLTFVGWGRGMLKLSRWYIAGVCRQWWRERRADWSVSAVCRHVDVPWIKAADVNTAWVVERLRAFAPDLLLSLQGQIVKPELLAIPRCGCINKHAGRLPDFRGVWPVFWALLHGEQDCIVTWHWMTPEIDRGGIVYQERIAVEPADTVFSLYQRMYDRLPGAVMALLRCVEQGATPCLQDVERGRYYTFPSRDDIHRLHTERGRRVV